MLQIAWPSSIAAAVLLAAKLTVPLCTALVLAAVALNFAEAPKAGPVARRKKSPVETGSMLAFFALVYLLIRFHVGDVLGGSESLHAAVASIGALLVVAGAGVNVAGRVVLGANWANQVTVYQAQTLVTRGVFGYVRHPLYASLIWMSVGASLVYANWAALVATLGVFVPAMHYRAGQEETLLEERFSGYADYRRHVPRFHPASARGYRDDRV
jgi:protein-S-isoprenylcysteine O-methyltransferase Ste14